MIQTGFLFDKCYMYMFIPKFPVVIQECKLVPVLFPGCAVCVWLARLLLRRGPAVRVLGQECWILVKIIIGQKQCCGSGMLIRISDPNYSHPGPGSTFFHPGSRIRIEEFKYLTKKMVSKLLDIWSGLFIPDPDPDFFTHPGSRIQGSKGHRIPDPEHRLKMELDLQSLFGLHVHSFTHWHLGSYIRGRYWSTTITNFESLWPPG